MTSTSWPPESLAVQTEDIINECELMEVFPERGSGKQFVPIIELAALLHTGEYVHARHVWRRWKENNQPALLLDWWRVGAAMMECDPNTLWQGLSHIQANHPAPLNAYATEVGIAYRKRILEKFAPTQPYLTLLNFSSPAELETFCSEYNVGPKYRTLVSSRLTSLNNSVDGKASLTQVLAFLESSPGNVRT